EKDRRALFGFIISVEQEISARAAKGLDMRQPQELVKQAKAFFVQGDFVRAKKYSETALHNAKVFDKLGL
ncbi:MAG: hypothetical protein QW728_06290, partial [Thermoplasmata archaeon]